MGEYRFKTRLEFIKEYGDRWRELVPNSWDEGMDCYLGQVVEDIDRNLDRCKMSGTLHIGAWSFSPEMYKEIEPEYKNGVMTIKNGLFKKN